MANMIPMDLYTGGRDEESPPMPPERAYISWRMSVELMAVRGRSVLRVGRGSGCHLVAQPMTVLL
jgi:hypothetical protein